MPKAEAFWKGLSFIKFINLLSVCAVYRHYSLLSFCTCYRHEYISMYQIKAYIIAIIIVSIVAGVVCCSRLPDDLPSLILLMNSNDMQVHTVAAKKVLKKYGVDGLLKALDSPLPGAKVQAARFLRLNPDYRARIPLLKATRDRDIYVRGWAAFALSSFPDNEVVARLNELLFDPEPLVQSYARKALKIIAI